MTFSQLNAKNHQQEFQSVYRQEKKFYRSVFLSDFHIGAKSFDARAALDFLQKTECQTLYLVGDIIDGWKLKKRWRWNDDVSAIFDTLLYKSRNGTKIIYIPGNHDEELRFLNIFQRRKLHKHFNIEIKKNAVHETLDGKRFLILHGDEFDTKILSRSVLTAHHKISEWFFDWVGAYTPKNLHIFEKGKFKRFSLSKFLSKHGRLALQVLNNYEGAVYHYVKKHPHLDGIICGHTHIPVIKMIKDLIYVNTGCWLRKSHTAIVESESGGLSLIDWPESEKGHQKQFTFNFGHSENNIIFQHACSVYRPETEKLIRMTRKFWSKAETKGQVPDYHIKIQENGLALQKTEQVSNHKCLDIQNLFPAIQLPSSLSLTFSNPLTA